MAEVQDLNNTLQHLVEDVSIYEDIYDYVLVFKNPFDVPSKQFQSHSFSQTISCLKAEADFQLYFKSNVNDSAYLSEYNELKQFLMGKDKISSQDLAQRTISCALKLLQQTLHLEVRGNLSEDNETILIKLRSSEGNLKVQADLLDYSLQFRANPTDNLDFQKVSPYGPYEKKDEIDEKIYKHYDNYGNEAETGSLFTQTDRIRLVYSMISSIFELSELLAHGILDDHFALNSQKVLKELNQE